MPTFVHGRNGFLTIDGIAVNVVATDANMTQSVDTAESSVMGTLDKEFVPGMKDSQLSATVRYDRTTQAQLEALLGSGEVAVVFGPEGDDTGARQYTFNALLTQLDVNASTGDVVGGSMTLQRTGATTFGTF